jgi:hypothetical protein
VERASLARPWCPREHRDAHLTSVSALCLDLHLFKPKSAAYDESALSLALLATASQARHAPRLNRAIAVSPTRPFVASRLLDSGFWLLSANSSLFHLPFPIACPLFCYDQDASY